MRSLCFCPIGQWGWVRARSWAVRTTEATGFRQTGHTDYWSEEVRRTTRPPPLPTIERPCQWHGAQVALSLLHVRLLRFEPGRTKGLTGRRRSLTPKLEQLAPEDRTRTHPTDSYKKRVTGKSCRGQWRAKVFVGNKHPSCVRE